MLGRHLEMQRWEEDARELRDLYFDAASLKINIDWLVTQVDNLKRTTEPLKEVATMVSDGVSEYRWKVLDHA